MANQSTVKTVGITGATIWGNRGAEAMLVTTIGRVRERYPDARFYVFSYFPERDRQLINDPAITVIDGSPRALVLGHFPFAVLAWLFRLVGIKWSLMSPSARALRECDVLADVSGISFADGREKFVPFNILTVWPAMLVKTPVVKMAQAVGSFKSPIVRYSAKLFMSRCRYVFARGAITAEYIRDLGLPEHKWETVADVAFSYKPEYSLSSENDGRVDAQVAELESVKAAGHRIIGLSPSSLVNEKSTKSGRDYVGQFIKLVNSLSEDYHFVVLPNATREGIDQPRNNDIHVISIMRQRMNDELTLEQKARIHYVDYDINTAGSRRLIACCDLLVTSRFHGMVSSLSLTVPVMVIGWSHKYAEVLSEFDMERFAIDFNDPNLNLQAMVDDLKNNQEAIQAQLADALVKVKASSGRQFEYLTEDLLS